MVKEKGAPCADKTPPHDKKEECCHDGTENRDAYEGIRRNGSGLAAAPQDTCTDEGMSCRKIHDSADKHSDAAHSKRFGIGRIEGKDFFSENGSEGECDGGTDKGPFNACPFKRVPFGFRFFADGLPCGDHARFAEAYDVVPVNIGNIHTDTVDGKGNRAKACRHAGEKNHAYTLKALFTEDRKENRCDFFEIRLIRNERTAFKKVIFFHKINRPAQTENGAYDCTDCRAGDTHGRNRPHAEDQDEIHDDIHEISQNICLHDDCRLAEAELDCLEKEGE